MPIFTFRREYDAEGVRYVEFFASSKQEAREWVRKSPVYLGPGKLLVPDERDSPKRPAGEVPAEDEESVDFFTDFKIKGIEERIDSRLHVLVRPYQSRQ